MRRPPRRPGGRWGTPGGMSKPSAPLEALLKAGTSTRFVVISAETLLAFVTALVTEVHRQTGTEAPKKAFLSADEVRALAGCSSARVSGALNSRELPGTKAEHGQPRVGQDGRTIPNFRWSIARADAEAFAHKVQEDKQRRRKPG